MLNYESFSCVKFTLMNLCISSSSKYFYFASESWSFNKLFGMWVIWKKIGFFTPQEFRYVQKEISERQRDGGWRLCSENQGYHTLSLRYFPAVKPLRNFFFNIASLLKFSPPPKQLLNHTPSNHDGMVAKYESTFFCLKCTKILSKTRSP